MTNRRVRAGQEYRYEPVGWDRFFPANQGLEAGELVRVVNLPGCPKAGTMGHCHVVRVSDGRFAGLVHVNSLAAL